jgi:hypothetical protein
MRVFLVVSVALIGLFAGQCSLHATLVYRYEWTYYQNAAPTAQENPHSGYIDFLDPSNSAGADLDAVYDLRFTSFPGVDGNGVLPTIPATTFSLLDASLTGLFTWNEHQVSGVWSLSFAASPLFCRIDSASVQSFYPLAYVFNEASQSGGWVFTGTRNVPETGGTVLILILSGIALGGCRLATRATKPECKTG